MLDTCISGVYVGVSSRSEFGTGPVSGCNLAVLHGNFVCCLLVAIRNFRDD